MSAESKRIKIMTLIEMFLGVALVVAGIVLVVMAYASKKVDVMLAGEGAITFVFGMRGALIANVPARISQLAKLAMIVLILQIACLAAMVLLVGVDLAHENVPQLCCGGVPVLLTLAILVQSRGMAKRAER